MGGSFQSCGQPQAQRLTIGPRRRSAGSGSPGGSEAHGAQRGGRWGHEERRAQRLGQGQVAQVRRLGARQARNQAPGARSGPSLLAHFHVVL